MLTNTTLTHNSECEMVDGQTWHDLYSWLLPLVEIWVRDSRVSSWYGQYKEIAEDIAHEAVMRAFRYHLRARNGEMPPIVSLKALSRVIARNYFRDWRKKDWCLVHPTYDDSGQNSFDIGSTHEIVDASQIALDHLMFNSLIVTVAQVVAKFPHGQKVALLTDLANISDLDSETPTLLEQALSDVGLQLSDYKRPRSEDPTIRGRDAALRSIAYKRLKHEVKV